MTTRNETKVPARWPASIPVEIYTDQRIAEFDAAEAELAAFLDSKFAARPENECEAASVTSI